VLDPAGRVVETARMLGGATVTATTLQHAQEMLAQGMADSGAGQPARAGKDGKRGRRAAAG
jgi:DNA repair protein RecN (Recombination protein N)